MNKKAIYTLTAAAMLCCSSTPILAATDNLSPYTIEGLTEASDGWFDFNPDNLVYHKLDIDHDGKYELVVKEKTHNYDLFAVYNIEDNKVNLIATRSSGGYEVLGFNTDGYISHEEEHTGGLSNATTYYKLKNSKVYIIATESTERESFDSEDMSIEYSVSIDGKVVSKKKKEYDKVKPQGDYYGLDAIDDWKEFPVKKSKTQNQVQSLKTSGTSVEDIVPNGWTATVSASGDVNKDGVKDLVILSYPNDASKIITTEMDTEVNTNKPVIAIYIGQSDGTYKLWRETATIIPSNDEEMSIENQKLEIKSNGVIWISWSDFFSMGSGDTTSYKRLYRFQNGDFYLIGSEDKSFSRMTHEGVTVNYNYITHKKFTHVSIEGGASPKDKTEDFEAKPLVKFGTETEFE